jgi:long-chain acyl-CoA synthetase
MSLTERLDRDVLRRKTAPLLLCERARATPERVAFRSKYRGRYRERRWRDYAMLVTRMARALSALGLSATERVAIMGNACEEWVICDLAAQSLGAIVYGIYPFASMADIEYQMRDGGAAIFIVQNREYVDKILPLVDRCPALRTILVIDEKGMFGSRHPKLKRLSRLLGTISDELDWLEAQALRLKPEDPAFIVYTSGTTGNPKGALISHGTNLAAAATISDHYPVLHDKPHRTVVFLPLSHVLGRHVAVTLPLISLLVPHFGESTQDLAATLFETAPTVLIIVPRYLQKFASQVLVAMQHSSPVKRMSYELAMRFARAHVRRRWDGSATRTQGMIYRACQAMIFRPILKRLGLGQLELVLSSGGPLAADTMALWHMYGVNVVVWYGQTETAGGIIAGQRGSFPRPGDVGIAPEGCSVTLAPDGEVLFRSPDLFEFYWQNEQATRAVKLADGTLRTGDVGEWRDGKLRLVDRARDFIVTSGGKNISPVAIETILRTSPYITEAVVFGHGRNYLTAVIEINVDTIADWMRGCGVPSSEFTSLASNVEVERLIAAEIDRINEQLSLDEQIKAFRILPRALDSDKEGGPVTPTRKVKRRLIQEQYKALIEAMYDDNEERLIAAATRDINLDPGLESTRS